MSLLRSLVVRSNLAVSLAQLISYGSLEPDIFQYQTPWSCRASLVAPRIRHSLAQLAVNLLRVSSQGHFLLLRTWTDTRMTIVLPQIFTGSCKILCEVLEPICMRGTLVDVAERTWSTAMSCWDKDSFKHFWVKAPLYTVARQDFPGLNQHSKVHYHPVMLQFHIHLFHCRFNHNHPFIYVFCLLLQILLVPLERYMHLNLAVVLTITIPVIFQSFNVANVITLRLHVTCYKTASSCLLHSTDPFSRSIKPSEDVMVS